MDRLREISQAIVDGLTQLDPRCHPDNDVFVFFSKFGTDEIATWQGGRFHEVPGAAPNPLGGGNAA